MHDKCTVKGSISSMPDIPGILVFLPGHVGVYIGNGYVIEAKGHAYGVVKTKLAGRGWKSWGKCHWITYESTTTTVPKPQSPTPSPTKPSTAKVDPYKVGKVYTLKVDLNIRVGAGTNYRQKKRSELTKDGQKHAQTKLVRAIKGSVFDVAVDMRDGSPTYLKWYGIELTEENKKQFYIPKGFLHGFLVLSDYAEFCYKCDDYYHPEDEAGVAYNDPTIGVEWPITEDMVLNLSEKDKNWSFLK